MMFLRRFFMRFSLFFHSTSSHPPHVQLGERRKVLKPQKVGVSRVTTETAPAARPFSRGSFTMLIFWLEQLWWLVTLFSWQQIGFLSSATTITSTTAIINSSHLRDEEPHRFKRMKRRREGEWLSTHPPSVCFCFSISPSSPSSLLLLLFHQRQNQSENAEKTFTSGMYKSF